MPSRVMEALNIFLAFPNSKLNLYMPASAAGSTIENQDHGFFARINGHKKVEINFTPSFYWGVGAPSVFADQKNHVFAKGILYMDEANKPSVREIFIKQKSTQSSSMVSGPGF